MDATQGEQNSGKSNSADQQGLPEQVKALAQNVDALAQKLNDFINGTHPDHVLLSGMRDVMEKHFRADLDAARERITANSVARE